MRSRRQFVSFFGRSLAGACLASSGVASGRTRSLPFVPIRPRVADELRIADGFRANLLIKEGDALNTAGDLFGANNDFLALVPFAPGAKNDALLWVNHEDFTPLFVSGYDASRPKTAAQVERERRAVGGSIVRVRRSEQGKWSVAKGDPHNRRITAATPIPIVAERPIAGSTTAIGTLGNCGGGATPWGTVLTAEENYQNYYGEVNYRSRNPRNRIYGELHHGWDYFHDHSPEHYGWIVEVDVRRGSAKKLAALGRFAHEGALVVPTSDGRCVVYMGDDAADQCLYKFVASEPGSLERGELFVANLKRGEWTSLDRRKHAVLQERFADQTELLVRARVAAALVGGTPLDRPEDIEQDPMTKAILVTLTSNKNRGNLHGSILKIVEHDDDPRSRRFRASTFLSGGPATGFSCPDNLAFDARGNLWMTSDISSSALGTGEYERFGNNGLFYVPMEGPDAGRVFQVASAPRDAEFTGPCFSPDGRELFLSVQHPGEASTDPERPTSSWPDGPGRPPRSAVVVLSGPALESLVVV